MARLGGLLSNAPVTSTYALAILITTVVIRIGILSPLLLHYDLKMIVVQHQWWRLVTTFLFFGTSPLRALCEISFLIRFCYLLETTSFRGKTSDFVMMFIFGIFTTLTLANLTSIIFFGPAFTMMFLYVWSRRKAAMRMNFILGLNIHARFFPVPMLGLSYLLGNPFELDIIGITVGHVYYFLEDVFPNQRGGIKILKTPRFLKYLLDSVEEDVARNVPADERPGGFAWGPDGPVQPDEPQPELQPPEIRRRRRRRRRQQRRNDLQNHPNFD